MRQLVYQTRYTGYQVSFYLWVIGSVLKHYQGPECYDQNCVKSFSLLSALPVMIRISGKKTHLIQKG